MKKSILFAAMLAAVGTAQVQQSLAQKLTYIPWTENALLQVNAISHNGVYLAGGDQAGRGFIYNTQTGENKFFFDPALEEGDGKKTGRIYDVNDNGVGMGTIASHATKFDFATGEYTQLFDEENNSSARFINNDGTFSCGFVWKGLNTQSPYVLVDGEQRLLPEGTEDWIGYETEGFAAMDASDDGSVVMGRSIDNFGSFPLMVWVLNKDSVTYSLVPVSKRFFDSTYSLTNPQDYQMFKGTAISANGRWIAIDAMGKDYTEGMRVMRYDVLNDMVEEIDCPDADGKNFYTSTAISDDGTIIGYVDNQQTGARASIIVKGGENVAQYMTDVYEDVPEIAKMELNGCNTPMDISPDGRYIIGFGYVDYNEETLCWGSYWIDTQAEPDAVKEVAKKDNAAAQNKVVGTYTLDGKQVNVSTTGGHKGLFIDKMADGRFVKRVR